ncbi:putative (+)-neomenthol dehydrogenase [Helianthus annuus]|nr:putative (+)-neomenthol dehydrogenase [Helianthus annuus]
MEEHLQVTDDNVDNLTGILEEPYDTGKNCLDINYYGTKRVTETLVPLLQLSKSPRIVNVTSAYGEMRLKQEFLDIENLTEARIDEIVQWFLRDLKDAKLRENGWPLTVSAYKVSKAALNAYTRLMARKFQNNILVNAVHPGYVPTDMTSRTGIHTVEEAANTVVRVALLADDGPSGVYFNKMEIAPFT